MNYIQIYVKNNGIIKKKHIKQCIHLLQEYFTKYGYVVYSIASNGQDRDN